MVKSLITQRDTAKTPQRRRPVSAEEREAIIVACVEGRTQAEIARELARSEHTIRSVLRSEYGRQRRDELLNEVKDAAVTRLRRSAVRAADSWIRQLALADAGERANHLPAKELLTHTGVLDVASPTKDEKTQIIIQIGGAGIPDEPVELNGMRSTRPTRQPSFRRSLANSPRSKPSLHDRPDSGEKTGARGDLRR